MKVDRDERKMMREFVEFIETEQASPGPQVDESILHMVAKDLSPARWKVYCKLTLVEIASGLTTLMICPQFGLGLGSHNELLHTLHSATSPAVFYLLCGLFFVILGGTLGGMVLNQEEIRTVARRKFFYFSVFSIVAYIALVSLGSEVFVVGSLAWILGALLGNVLSFEIGVSLRKAII